MTNQYVNKVIVNNEIKMDLTEDTVTSKTLRKGFTAHDASGAPIVGNESLTDISEDGTDAGPIAELTANGWANQTQLSGKNLWPILTNRTVKDVTATVASDGTITIDGTNASDSSAWILWNLETEIPAGTYTVSANNESTNSGVRIVLNHDNSTLSQNVYFTTTEISFSNTYASTINRIGIVVSSGTTVSNLKIRPQLELGSTATEYEPYCGGVPSPNPDYPQEIRVAKGRNLLDETLLLQINNWTVSDGVYSGNTQPVHHTFGDVFPTESFENGQYVASFDLVSNDTSKNSLAFVWYYTDNTNERLTCKSSTHYTFVSNASKTVDHIALSHNSNVDISLSHFQLEKGSVATPYVPYGFVGVEAQGKNLLNLPSASSSGSGYPLGSSRFPISLSAGTYSFSFDSASASGQWVCAFYDANNIKVVGPSARAVVSGTNTVTLTANADITRFEWYINAAYDVSSVQLELGSTATEYEPYNHKTIPVPLPERGWVGGLPDGTTDILKLNTAGKYEWSMGVGKYTIDGTETLLGFTQYSDAYYRAYLEITASLDDPRSAQTDNFVGGLCTHSTYGRGSNTRVMVSGNKNGSKRTTVLLCDNIDNVEGLFAEYVGAEIYYALHNITTEQGYVPNWDNTLPEHCTIDIPELRDISVRYYLDTASVEPAQRYYERANAELNQVIDDASNDATLEALAAIAPIEGDISSANYLVGAYLIHDNQLCEVTTPIATGEAITVGTNVVISSVATELGELQVAVQDIIDDPYILPTMSASEKGGAKVGQGLRIDDDILSVDMSSGDVTDAGPLISLQAEGWAEQTQYSGKNLFGTVIYKFPSRQADRTIIIRNGSSERSYVGEVLPNTTYTISANGGDRCMIGIVDSLDPTVYVREVGTFSNDGSSNLTNTFTTQADEHYVMLYIVSDVSTAPPLNWVQLELGSTATSYEPYCGGVPSPNPDYPQDIRVARGRNLLPKMMSGSYYTVNDDNSITITQTVLSNTYFMSPYTIDLKAGETYTLSGGTPAFYAYIQVDGTNRIAANGPVTFTPLEDTSVNVVYVVKTEVSIGATVYAQLERGSVATPYVPYGYIGVDVTANETTTTIPIPLPSKGFAAALPDGTSDILRLDGAGKWEWESKTGMLDLASLTWKYYVSASSSFSPYFYVNIADTIAYDGNFGNVVYPALAEDFVITRRYLPLMTDGRICFDGNVTVGYVTQVQCKMTDITTVADFMTALGDSSLLLYKAANPTTEQGYLDNWDNNIPLHATIDIPELRNIGVECYMDEQASTLNAQWSERLRSEMDGTATNAVTESLASLAPVENDISSANYSTGSYLIHNNQLYKVTSPIAIGETISTSTNVTAVTLSDDVKYLNDHPYILPTMSEDTKGGAKVGHGLYVENDILSIGGVDDPTDAGPIVELSANGWSEQFTTTGKNLLPNTATSQTINGVTFTVNADGSVTVNGTATANAQFQLCGEFSLAAGSYVLRGCVDGGNSSSYEIRIYDGSTSYRDYGSYGSNRDFTLSSDTTFTLSEIIVRSGATVNNLVFKPQLELGSTATSYEPYTGGAPSPSPSYPQDIRVCRGRNLLPNNAVSQTLNGITSTVNSNGSITVNGTATARTVLVVASFNLVAGMYTLSDGGGGNGAQWYLEIHDVTDNLYYSIKTASPTSFTIDATKQVYAYIVIDNGKTVSNVTFYPQLELGSVATPYVPYGYLGCEVQGKNLIPNGLNDSTTYANVTITRKDGVLIFNGTSNGAGGRTNAFYKNQQTTLLAGTYTLSHISSGTGRVNVAVQKLSDNTVLANTTDTRTFTLTEPTMIFVGCNLVANTTYTNLNVKIQLERGSEATEYEPCHNTTIPIPLPERGYVAALTDGTSDILTIDGAGGYVWELNTDEVVIDGSIACDYVSASTVHTDALRARVAAVTGTPSRNAYNGRSSHFTSGSTASWANMGVGQFYLDGSGVILGMPIATIDTTAKVTAWLQSNPIIILYALTTPTTEQGYIESMPTVPDHATLTCPEMRDLVIRCCADAGAAEISQAWAKRFKMELDELREIVNGLASNS